MDQRALAQGKIHRDGIHQQIIGRWIQALNGPPHGQARSLQDIDAINLESIGGCYGASHGALANPAGQHFAPFGIQHLAVAQAANGTVGRKDHGRGEHGSEQSAAPDLVDTGDPLETLRPRFVLVLSLASHR